MEITLANLLGMVRDTLREPRAGAARIMALNVPSAAGWTALLLMAVGSTLLTHLSIALMPASAQDYLGPAMSSPIRTAIIQWVVMLVSVHAAYRIGRWRGGDGSLSDTVALMAWLQFILLCVQVLQLVAQVIVPPLSNWLGIAGLLLFFWLLTNFVAELHGFRRLGLVFVGVLLTLLIAGVVLGLAFALLIGVPVQGA